MMRQLKKQIAILERIDQLIRLKATGNPRQLANRLEVSEATVFRIIETMKELDAPVFYDMARQSYSYSEPAEFRFGFYLENLDENSQKSLSGGFGLRNMRQLMQF